MIRLNIKPFSKERPRFTNGRTYMNPKYTTAKKDLANLYRASEYRNIDFKGKAVNVEVMFCFTIPKSWTKKMKAKPDHRRIVQDIDNLAGSVMDALNKIAWVDDKDIVSMTASKRYCESGDCIFLSIKEKKEYATTHGDRLDKVYYGSKQK